jgi:uncharacterized protein YecE (DUF72 family)
MAGRVLIGTSGWHYPHWKGPFYPRGLRQDQYLAYYARFFRSAEINNSFYKLPSEETFRRWAESVPAGFTFAVKASRYITHMKKLIIEPARGVFPLFARVGALGDTLGPLVFQLPPRWRFDGERLRLFLKALPAGFRYAFEFRDPSWLNEYTYALLEARHAAFCIYELNGMVTPPIVTADFVYIRLHGPAGPYQGRYGPARLERWASAIRDWSAEGRDVYLYFDNDQAGYAVEDAMCLQAMRGW